MNRVFAEGLSLCFWGAQNGFYPWIVRRRHAARRLTMKPRVEELEDRTVLSPLIVLASGLNLADVATEERGGIYIVRPDGTGLKQITAFQTHGFNFSGDGLILSDDHPAFSPDGKQIVFTSNRDADNLSVPVFEQDFEIYVMDVNGTNVRRLTTSPGIDTEPAFSPDGSKIAFASTRAGNLDIWVMNADGSNPQRLTSSAFHETEPAWSPDGTKIAYTRVIDTGPLNLGLLPSADKDVYIMNANGTNNHLVFGGPKEQHDPNWSPDGTKLAITGEGESIPFGDVVLINPVTGAFINNLTTRGVLPLVGGDPLFGGGDPSWSPDGTKIAYFKATGPLISFPMRLFVMNANGTNKQFIQIPGLVNVHPNWGIEADTDGDGTPDYQDVTSTTLTQREFNTGVTAGDNFGTAVALADLTHDTFLDVVVGIPGENSDGVSNSGRIALARGSGVGSSSQSLPSSMTAAFFGGTVTANGRFGQTVVSGDFNGDGFSDLAVGAPGQNRVFISYGAIGPFRVLSGSGDFGAALAVGDFNNDGKQDLAVGAPLSVETAPGGASVVAGSVQVSFGSAAGLAGSPQSLDQGNLPLVADVGAEEAGDRFGATLAAGDVTGDGIDDLAIGVPGEDIAGVPNAGMIHVMAGRVGQLLQTSTAVARDARALPSPHNGLQANAEFGETLAIGFFKVAVFATRELVVGIPHQDVNGQADAGLIAVFSGRSPVLTSGSPLGSGVRVLTITDVGGASGAGNRFGQNLAVGKFSGDSIRDLAIAAPGAVVNGVAGAGEIYLVLGGNGTVTSFTPIAFGANDAGLVAATAQRINQSHVGLGNDFETNDHFGGSFTFPSANTLVVGDLDKNGLDDLLIGTPGEDGPNAADAGAVSIRYGNSVGTFTLAANAKVIHTGARATWTLTWNHPRNWHALDDLHFRILDEKGRVVAWVRWDERSNTFSVYNMRTGQFGRSLALGSRRSLPMRGATLELSRSSVVGSGPQGLSVTLTISLKFNRRAPAGNYHIELLATDDRGFSQGFEPAGILIIHGHRRGPHWRLWRWRHGL